ncbi:tetratricopeptide repeat protein [Haloferula chungangensis]|uniref:Tetratricopeptide repeat protein n=1 Tax=Haloferula chungangensis TaxID=1048331 RepID=A0ABW2L6Z9_9BACT
MNPLTQIPSTWANLHILWRFLIVLLLLGAGLLAALVPGKAAYHRWKSSRNFEEASKALAASRFTEARDLSLQILRQDSTSYEALPILLRSASALKDPKAGDVAIAILRDIRSTPEDKVVAWRYLCQSGPTYIPLKSWAHLTDQNKQSLDYQLPIIDRLLYDQMLPAATAIVISFPKPYPVELNSRLLTILARKNSPESLAEFHRRLASQLRDTPEAWPRLLETVDEISQADLARDVYDALPESAHSQPSSDPLVDLRITRCQMAAQPEKSEELLRAAIKRHEERHSIELARWLLQIGHPEEAANFLSLGKPSEFSDLYQLQLQYLEATGANDKLKSFLEAAPREVPNWKVQTRLAVLGRENGDHDLAKLAVKSALESATESADPAALIDLARDAQKRGLDDLSIDAWTRALIRGTGPLPPSESISHVIARLSAQGREDELYAVLSSLHAIESDNRVIHAQFLYISCLSGRAEAQYVVEQLSPLQEKYPELLALRSILAISHVLNGDFEKADELTNDPAIDWFSTNPAYRAIRGIVLAKNGKSEEASVYFEKLPWDDLLPSEKRVFETLAAPAAE